MFTNLSKFFEKNFGFLLLFFSILSFLIPKYFLWGENFLDELLMIGLFLGYLKINLNEIFHLKKNIVKMIFFVLGNLLLLPSIFYIFSPFLNNEIRIALFLLLGVSGAVMTPFLASLFNLKILWSTIFVILTSFLMPFTLPILIKTLFNISLKVSLLEMTLFLMKIIFIPTILAIILKKLLPKFEKKIIKTSDFIGVIDMLAFIGIIVASNQQFISQNLFTLKTIPILLTLFTIIFLRFFIGYLMPSENQEEKWTNSLMFGNTNNGLVILLGAQFFSEKILFIVLLSEIPWIISQSIFPKVLHTFYKNQP